MAERRSASQEADHDPSARIGKPGFRDAQRAVMGAVGDGPPPAEWVARLDPLAARLDRAEALNQGPHPDNWPLTERTAITGAVAAVVADFHP